MRSLDHAGQEQPGERGEGGDVDADHELLPGEVRSGKLAIVAQPGVVDQAIHSGAERLDLTEKARRRPWRAEVAGDLVHGRQLTYLCCRSCQAAGVAGDQNEITAVRCCYAGELEADAAVRSGDGRACGRLMRCHGCAPRSAGRPSGARPP